MASASRKKQLVELFGHVERETGFGEPFVHNEARGPSGVLQSLKVTPSGVSREESGIWILESGFAKLLL